MASRKSSLQGISQGVLHNNIVSRLNRLTLSQVAYCIKEEFNIFSFTVETPNEF